MRSAHADVAVPEITQCLADGVERFRPEAECQLSPMIAQSGVEKRHLFHLERLLRLQSVRSKETELALGPLRSDQFE
jgi:hypothetical protein